MKIIDGFTFFNEVSLLKLRLMVLRDVVDVFVIAEMDTTHSGLHKGFVLESMLDSLPVERDRIVYVKVGDTPRVDPSQEVERWRLENFQRNAIARGLDEIRPAGDDVVLISDLDEIPDPVAIKAAVRSLKSYRTVVLCQAHRKYFINSIARDYETGQCWLGTIATTYEYLSTMTPQELRRGGPFPRAAFIWTTGRAPDASYIEPGGWHLTYFGGPSFVNVKHQSIVEGWQAAAATEFRVPDVSRHNWSDGRTEDVVHWFNSLDAYSLPVKPYGFGGLKYLPQPVLDDPMNYDWLWWFSDVIDRRSTVPAVGQAG